MSRLEPLQETDAGEEAAVSMSIDGGATQVSVPPDAGTDEAAAVAAAIGALLSDRQRAAAVAAAATARSRQPVDRWRLAGRFETDRTDRWLDVEDGEEWRAASRRY